MKWLRLAIVSGLLLSVSVGPSVLAKNIGGSLSPSKSLNPQGLVEEWDITCPNGRKAVCVGSESTCLFLCDLFCGTAPGSCVTV